MKKVILVRLPIWVKKSLKDLGIIIKINAGHTWKACGIILKMETST